MKAITGAETPLEKHVQRWVNRQARDNYECVEDALSDLFRGGCASGMVGHLVYYTDTTRFYRRHREEIDTLLKELCEDTGCTPGKLFEDSAWDQGDFFARGPINRNILAWFGFEETARVLAQRNDIDA